MLRSQRILIIVGLVFIAWLVHVNMCDWAINRRMTYWSAGPKPYANTVTIILGWESSPVLNPNANGSGIQRGPVAYDSKITGVLIQRGVERREAIFLGVILPLALLIPAGFLWLGGRHASRVARGLCPTCGYDLRGGSAEAPLAKCPECGTPAKPARE